MAITSQTVGIASIILAVIGCAGVIYTLGMKMPEGKYKKVPIKSRGWTKQPIFRK